MVLDLNLPLKVLCLCRSEYSFQFDQYFRKRTLGLAVCIWIKNECIELKRANLQVASNNQRPLAVATTVRGLFHSVAERRVITALLGRFDRHRLGFCFNFLLFVTRHRNADILRTLHANAPRRSYCKIETCTNLISSKRTTIIDRDCH